MMVNDSVADVPRLLVITWSASFEEIVGVTAKRINTVKPRKMQRMPKNRKNDDLTIYCET